MKGRTLDLHDEEAVIGSLIVDNSALDEIGDYLAPGDFMSSFNRDAYCAIRDIIAEGKNADAVYVSQILSQRDGANDDNYFIRLCELMRHPFTSKNIKHYAETVKKKSIDRQMIVAAQEVIANVQEQAPNALDTAQQRFLEISETVKCETVGAADLFDGVLGQIEERIKNPQDVTGLASGFSDLDKITHGFGAGDLVILAGRPGMGKTLLGMNIAEHVGIKQKHAVAIFSMEMSRQQLLERSIASVASVSAEDVRTGKLTDVDLQRIKTVRSSFKTSKLFIDDRSALRVSDIRVKCRRIKREHGLSLVVIDYLTLMDAEGENETLRIGNISRGLKLIARDLDVPVIAISQLNRSVEQRNNKRPCMADLRQSGAIEQDADLILFIYREDVYSDTQTKNGMAELIIGKNRHGNIGTIHLAFNNRFCRFDNYSGNYIATFMPEKKQSYKNPYDY